MELRFVATEANEAKKITARPIPTLADSGVDLYAAATTGSEGAIWHFDS
jgi:hypothetical protein